MTSKERVIRAIKFKNPDRVPINLWYLQATKIKYGKQFDTLRMEYPEDFGDSGFEDPSGTEVGLKPCIHEDNWGCVWNNEREGILGQVIGHPLKELQDIRNYKPPVNLIEKGLKMVPETIKKNSDKFICGGGIDIFHRITYLRGFEETLIDLMDNYIEICRIRDMVFDFHMRLLKEWLKYDIDGIAFADDWGSQSQLFIPPTLWRDFIKPYYKEMISLVKKSGRLVLFHSDGYIMEIIPDLIEIGVDALNSQVWCMGLEEVSKRFRGKITFWGEVDRQHILPEGSTLEVQIAIDEMKKHLSTRDGGLIGQGEAGPDVSFENIEVLLSGWNKSGR